MRSVLLAVTMPAAAGCSGIDPDLQLVLARCWLHPDRASDTHGTCEGTHGPMPHCTMTCHATLSHTVLCRAGFDVPSSPGP